MNNTSVIICPNCGDYVIISKTNCGVFCHGVLKKNGKQISPHISKQKSNEYVKKGLIYGCGQHFTLVNCIIKK